MKKGNTTIIASIFAISLVTMILGGVTMAYFTRTRRSDGNSYEAGILDMALTRGSFTFDKLKPGDEWSIYITLENTGNLDIKYLVMCDENYAYTYTGTPADLGNMIDIVDFDEYEYLSDGTTVVHGPENCLGSTYEGWLWAKGFSNNDGHLSLKEFLAGFHPATSGGNDNWDLVTLSGNWGGGVLEVDHYYKMVINFKFRETKTPQDAYQGASCSFDLVWMGTTADKTELVGYVP